MKCWRAGARPASGIARPSAGSRPLALRYHGHQFFTYLGDERGFLFAQLLQDGRALDLDTKGSGQTPRSRHAD